MIDIGINRLKNGKIVGDFNYNVSDNLPKYITPVPGGIGPITIAALLQNTFNSFINNN